MKKKKIIVTAAQVPFVKGGAELHVQFLVKNLLSWGYDTEIVSLPFKWYPENTLYDNMLAWRLLDLEESNGEKIDLLIATKFPSYGAIHKNKVTWMTHQFRQVYDLYDTNVGLINEEHGTTIKNKVKRYDKLCLEESRQIYTISHNVSARLRKYNNIDSVPLYHPPALTGRYYCEGYGEYILSVGRLDKLKRNELLIEALCYCDKKITVKIAGKGPEMDNLKRLAQKYGIHDRVEFLGYVSDEDLLKLYANTFAVFFAPLDEDYGYITLEAFLSNKPVITCNDSGGVLEFVRHEENGYVTSTEPREMGGIINKLYSNKGRCREFGEKGCNDISEITWNNVIDKLTETIR